MNSRLPCSIDGKFTSQDSRGRGDALPPRHEALLREVSGVAGAAVV